MSATFTGGCVSSRAVFSAAGDSRPPGQADNNHNHHNKKRQLQNLGRQTDLFVLARPLSANAVGARKLVCRFLKLLLTEGTVILVASLREEFRVFYKSREHTMKGTEP